MKNCNQSFLFLLVGMLSFTMVKGQDPHLPPVNMGLTNLQAGVMKKPGWSYVQYLQLYHVSSLRDQQGHHKDPLNFSSALTTLQQLVYRSRVKMLNGQLGATVLLPLTLRTNRPGNTTNPGVAGDLLAGMFLEWRQTAREKELHYRFGVNAVFPTGNFDHQYEFNPGANRYRLFPHFEFTFTKPKGFGFSIKDNLYYFFRERGTTNKVGSTNALNYALEYKLSNALTIEAAGFWVKQFQQDSYDGDSHYYNKTYQISDTREEVTGVGPGFGFKTPGGVQIELKGMWEFGAVNRTQGFRSTLVTSFAL